MAAAVTHLAVARFGVHIMYVDVANHQQAPLFGWFSSQLHILVSFFIEVS
jgi:hypothetical protein